MFVSVAVCSWLAACSQTSRVGDDVTPAKLTESNKAVALMRVGAASGTCQHVGVTLGVREGNLFRFYRNIRVLNVRSVSISPVAEVELDPGDYHVIAYSCGAANGIKTISDTVPSDDGRYQVFRTSYTNFTVGPGEIVNVGYLHFGASHVGRSTFGRPFRVEVAVTDWPLDELERFKKDRPTIYGQMVTRLMKLTPDPAAEVSSVDCDRLKVLQAEGKVQQLPAACAPGDPTAARMTPAVAARSVRK